jgi:small subunit ribosomal protein S8
MHSDPIADMLTRIRNGGAARKSRVDIPFSRTKVDIARVLKAEGFIGDYREIAGPTPGQGLLEVKLRYDENNVPVIKDVQRVSKPSLRRYMGYEEIPKVRNGLGIMILTTSQGLMTDRDARKAHVGGEALCAVW